MPIIKSAKKKLRQDKKRQKRNALVRNALKDLIKKAQIKPTLGSVKNASSLADKAAKHNIIHKNNAARIKSALSKLVKGKSTKTKIKTRPL